MMGAGISRSSVLTQRRVSDTGQVNQQAVRAARYQSQGRSVRFDTKIHDRNHFGCFLNFLIRRALFWEFGFVKMKSVMRGGR